MCVWGGGAWPLRLEGGRAIIGEQGDTSSNCIVCGCWKDRLTLSSRDSCVLSSMFLVLDTHELDIVSEGNIK